jgi:hypothetical protein
MSAIFAITIVIPCLILYLALFRPDSLHQFRRSNVQETSLLWTSLCVICAVPGVAAWTAHIIPETYGPIPTDFPDGFAHGMMIILGVLPVLLIFAGITAKMPCPFWARVFAVVTNCSYPLFVGGTLAFGFLFES